VIKFDGSPRLQRALLIPHLVLAWLAPIVVVIFREIRLVTARDARVLADAQQADEEGAAVDDRERRAAGRAGALLRTVARARRRLRPSGNE
jgi:hypothetical protein